MSCCGRGKSLSRPGAYAGPSHRTAGARPPGAAAAYQPRAQTFEFTGSGAVVVTGPSTGTRYRFAGSGARVAVHPADVPSLAGVPGLKPVR